LKHASPSRLTHALAALAGHEVRAIGRALAGAKNRHKGVHEARKAIRRLRALLSFGGPVLGADGERLDRAWRALGRGLSRLRDAEVSVATAKALTQDADESIAEAWKLAIAALETRRNTLMELALSADPAFARRRRRVASMGEAVDRLPWDMLDDEAIAEGLKQSRKRVEKAGKRAAESGTAADLHRWRRRVRRLRMQLQAMDNLRENGIRPRGVHHGHGDLKEQIRLADVLGGQQDLQVLRGILRTMAEVPERAQLLAFVRQRIRQSKARGDEGPH
jgi:CHAD domain-containing protein